jgi:hypothetical protein
LIYHHPNTLKQSTRSRHPPNPNHPTKPNQTQPVTRTSTCPPSSRTRSPAAAAANSVASLAPPSASEAAAKMAVLESAPAASIFWGGKCFWGAGSFGA